MSVLISSNGDVSPSSGSSVKTDQSNVFLSSRIVSVVGAPLCFGQHLNGVTEGPKVLRQSGLQKAIAQLGWTVCDPGDAPMASPQPFRPSGKTYQRPLRAKEYDEDDMPRSCELGSACGEICRAVNEAAERGHFVLTLGGDHSVGSGTVAGMLMRYPDLCLIWVDAHGDINTPETSVSKRYHGMPVAHLLGWFKRRARGFEWMNFVPLLPEQSVGYVGLRDIDAAERELINRSGVTATTMRSIDRHGIGVVVDTVLAAVDPESRRPIHLSFDIDACDPLIAPGTGTRARGGLSYREAHYICEALHATGRLVSMDMVEVNPALDKEDEYIHGDDPCISEGVTKTVRLALELILSALGKVIL